GGRRGAMKDGDSLFGSVRAGDGVGQLLLEVTFRVVVLRENDDPRFVPLGGGTLCTRRTGRWKARAHVLPDPVDKMADPGIGKAPGGVGDFRHLSEKPLLGLERLRRGRG